MRAKLPPTLEAYRIIGQQYPAVNGFHGRAKIRELAKQLPDDDARERLLALIPHTPTREAIRNGLLRASGWRGRR